MKTNWDYTKLAKAYVTRPAYSGTAIDAMLKISDMSEGKIICDVGAGVAHLSLEFASRNYFVQAIEPNDSMRSLGEKRSKNFSNIKWQEGVGEATGQPSNYFDLVTFGSSFNVCDPKLAIEETARILRKKGWIACLYNNRNLEDPIQSKIESLITGELPNYTYGFRRQDHSRTLDASNMFGPVIKLSSEIIHTQNISVCVEAWKSHATLARQAGKKFNQIIQNIEEYLKSLQCEEIEIPYRTNVWLAQIK